MDLVVANDTQPNKLYRNQKNGTFGWTKLTYVADIAEKKADKAETKAAAADDEEWESDTEEPAADVPMRDDMLVYGVHARWAPLGWLGLGFAAEEMRGWRVASYTEETVEPDDVILEIGCGRGVGREAHKGGGRPVAQAEAAGRLDADRPRSQRIVRDHRAHLARDPSPSGRAPRHVRPARARQRASGSGRRGGEAPRPRCGRCR